MAKPMRTAGPTASQAVSWCRQHRPLKIIFAIPIPQITAEQHCENRLNIGSHQISRRRLIIRAGGAQATDARVLARPAAIGPQIAVATKRRQPCSGIREKRDVRRPEKWSE